MKEHTKKTLSAVLALTLTASMMTEPLALAAYADETGNTSAVSENSNAENVSNETVGNEAAVSNGDSVNADAENEDSENISDESVGNEAAVSNGDAVNGSVIINEINFPDAKFRA